MPHPKALNTTQQSKIKENTMRMFLCTIEPLILTAKLLLTALKSVITSHKFTNFVTIGDKNN